MFVADMAQGSQQFDGRGMKATLALDRFNDNSGDVGRIDIGTEEVVDGIERVSNRYFILRHGKWHVPNPRGHRTELFLVGCDLAGQGTGHQRATVKATGETNHVAAAG